MSWQVARTFVRGQRRKRGRVPRLWGEPLRPKTDDSSASSCTIQRFFFTRWIEASLLCSEVAPADLVEDALKAAPPCSKVALADSVENPLETSPLCSKVCMAESSEHLDEASPHATNSKAMRRFGRGKECTSFFIMNPRKRMLAPHFLKLRRNY